MDIKIIVATHKLYRMPEDGIYVPVQAGAALKEPLPYRHDNDGENISEKNQNYCELTALYWAWKNLEAEYIGLCHYRRHFKGHSGNDKWEQIMTGTDAEKLFKKAPVILPKKRNYYIETNYSQYVHAHHSEDLDTTRQILSEKYPEYVAAYDSSMKQTSGHRFNMMVMHRDLFDAYCTWLFDVLFELEARLDISDYSDYDARVFGFVSERLLDIWLETGKINYVEVPVVNMEDQHWMKKGSAFLKRKLTGGKNE